MKKLFFILAICLTWNFMFSQSDTLKTVWPADIIEPFPLTANPVNFPLAQATPVGDINGDGQEDLVFYQSAADERTPDLCDHLKKSIITTSSGITGPDIVIYGSEVHGIGDYNGDGYDDILEIDHQKISFGCPEGISEECIFINFPESFNVMPFSGDINNDGMSEFFLLQDWYTDTLLIYSGVDSIPIVYDPGTWYSLYDPDKSIYECYDYDLDGEDEICISSWLSFYDTKVFYWYYLDKTNRELILEQNIEQDYIHEPSFHYPTAFSDINGDQLPDATHVYYLFENDSVYGYHLEVNFGMDTIPYFSPPLEIEAGVRDRHLYPVGDFNGDGADDWFGKCHPDSMVIYFGNQNIIESGFSRQSFYQGAGQLYLPKSYYYLHFESCFTPPLARLDYNNDGIDDLYLNYWKFAENLQYKTIGTAVVIGGETPDFENPEIIGRSDDETFKKLEYGYNSKKIGDMNQDGYADWGILTRTGCYLEVYYGGAELDLEPDITYFLPQTNKANCFDWTMGDMNNDGWIDIVISNSSVSGVAFVRDYMHERNDVFIFFGGPELRSEYMHEDADVVLHDNNTFYRYGQNIAIVGDYNADGFDDLVLGGGKHRHCLREAFVYFGGDEIGPEPDLVLSRPCTQ